MLRGHTGFRVNVRALRAIIASTIAAALLAGCATTTTPTGSGGTPTPTQGATTPTPTSGGTTPTPTQGGTTRACPGPAQAVTIGSPALVLTRKEANKTASARVGELVVVELPATNRWSLATKNSSLGTLTARAQQGAQDTNTNTCVWIWQAQSKGTAVIVFIGTALCQPGVPCPAYAVAVKFTVNIS